MRTLSKAQQQIHIKEIEAQGFSIMEDAIDDPLRRAVELELARLEVERPGGDMAPAPFSGQVTRRWFDLLNDGDVWQEVAIHPWVLAVLPRVTRMSPT